jgi:DNA polymerase-1
MKKILLIDGNSLLFRSFYANQTRLSANGKQVNGVYTFANSILSFLESNDYYDVRIAFDKGKQTFRHKMYDDYKGGRTKTPEELIEQFPIAREFVNATGIGFVELDEYEADDIIGTYSKIAKEAGYDVDILTSDKDMYQLVNDHVKVLAPVSGISKVKLVDKNYIFENFKVGPTSIPDFKGLQGDPSDNIKGVVGIGEVGARNLLSKYQTLENLYDHIDEVTGATHDKLVNGKESAFFSKHLATIVTDIDLDNQKFEGYEIDIKNLFAFFNKYNMISLQKKYCSEVTSEVASFDYLESNNFDKITFGTKNYIYVELLNDDYHNPNIIGIGLNNGSKTFFVSLESLEASIFNWNDSVISQRFQNVLIDNKTEFYTYDVKRTILALKKIGYKINEKQFVFDTKSAIYVLDPEAGNKPEKQLLRFTEIDFIEDDELIFGKGMKRTVAISESVKKEYIAKKTFLLSTATEKIINELQEHNQKELYFEIDHKLNFVLLRMEENGIAIDEVELQKQTEACALKIVAIEKQIKDVVAEFGVEELNIASPKQLKELLFDKIGLQDRHKGSTDREALEELEHEHLVVPLILEYRKLSKLYSTYLKGFEKYIRKGFVHTKFNQSLTATGRLSSSDPNLQNISVRDELQKQVRKVFVTRDKTNLFYSLDYSQIELRVLAQMSGEHNMIDMFLHDRDIHEEAARKIFKLDEHAKVDSDMRRVAKVFNFGIIYGLSDFGLSRDLKISIAKAKEFIQSYFETFKDLKNFKDGLITSALECGFAKTMSNRRRYIPQLKEGNHQVKSFGERIAVNMPIQGTAADIIKVAMIKIQDEFESQELQSMMIAQIHDELIFEVIENERTKVKEIIERNMEAALSDLFRILKINDPIQVKLAISFSEGQNWYEIK